MTLSGLNRSWSSERGGASRGSCFVGLRPTVIIRINIMTSYDSITSRIVAILLAVLYMPSISTFVIAFPTSIFITPKFWYFYPYPQLPDSQPFLLVRQQIAFPMYLRSCPIPSVLTSWEIQLLSAGPKFPACMAGFCCQ